MSPERQQAEPTASVPSPARTRAPGGAGFGAQGAAGLVVSAVPGVWGVEGCRKGTFYLYFLNGCQETIFMYFYSY